MYKNEGSNDNIPFILLEGIAVSILFNAILDFAIHVYSDFKMANVQ